MSRGGACTELIGSVQQALTTQWNEAGTIERMWLGTPERRSQEGSAFSLATPTGCVSYDGGVNIPGSGRRMVDLFALGPEVTGTLAALTSSSVAGARFDAIVLQSGDGLQLRDATAQAYDRQIEARCSPKTFGDVTVCEPFDTQIATTFADRSCATPIVAHEAAATPAKRFWRDRTNSTDVPPRYFALADLISPATVYGWKDGRCVERPLASTLEYRALTPLDRRIARTTEPSAHRLQRIRYAHEPAWTAPELFDSELDTECRFIGARCLPTRLAVVLLDADGQSHYYSDAACTSRIMIASELPGASFARDAQDRYWRVEGNASDLYELGGDGRCTLASGVRLSGPVDASTFAFGVSVVD